MKFFFHPSPNPMKVALLLEELQTPYELIGVDTFKGEQHLPAFLAINPNARFRPWSTAMRRFRLPGHPAAPGAEASSRLLPSSAAGNAELLSWLMFIATGLSPFSGQAVHFLHHAPEGSALREKPLFQGSRTPLSRTRPASGRPSVPGWRQLQHRRHGTVGLGQLRAVHPSAKTAWRPTPTSSACSMKSAPRPAAQRALGLKEKLVLKAEFDEETRRNLFPQNQAR